MLIFLNLKVLTNLKCVVEMHMETKIYLCILMFTKIMIAIVEIMIKIAMPNVYAVVMIKNKRFENTVLHFDIANTLCILKK